MKGGEYARDPELLARFTFFSDLKEIAPDVIEDLKRTCLGVREKFCLLVAYRAIQLRKRLEADPPKGYQEYWPEAGLEAKDAVFNFIVDGGHNGGPTFTHALLKGSPAIDAGDDAVLGNPFNLTTDQRGPGFFRKSGQHVDIGAFEVQQFDTCLRDNSTGNLLQWNSTTGQYKFTRCSDGLMVTGTGVAKLVNGIRTLTDFKTDRRISAGFNTGQLTGNATIYLMVTQGVWQSFQIVDTNPAAVCECPG